MPRAPVWIMAGSLPALATAVLLASTTRELEPGALDTEYQAAVKNHDVATMDRILDDDFFKVTGNGLVYSKADLLAEARDTAVIYEHQEDSYQTVRRWGNTAIVTALLWEKGTRHGKPFDLKLWFSDTYVRTPTGWRYIFGQASLPLANPPHGEEPAANRPM